MRRRMPAEWERQAVVLLAWPHNGTDWAGNLELVQSAYMAIIRAIAWYEPVKLVVPDEKEARLVFSKTGDTPFAVDCVQLPYDDTWLRDSGPVTVIDSALGLVAVDFRFNGWGGKFEAARDDSLTAALQSARVLGNVALERSEFVMEGGSIECDGCGTILTTSSCLLHPSRNPGTSKEAIEQELIARLGARSVLWLEHGWLEGDDTDGHVDMLARFAPGNVILYVDAPCGNDRHACELKQMYQQLSGFRNTEGIAYRLEPLPFPAPAYDADGCRLPLSYANFLVLNDAVLVPQYGLPEDGAAVKAVGRVFPGYAVIGVDCRALIQQHGAIHCISMQIPEETAK